MTTRFARRSPVLAALALGLLAGAPSPAAALDGRSRVVTVRMVIEHSRFVPEVIRVRAHTEVRFVVVNRDPIGHELIVGDDAVHARHRNGQEPYHPPVPGEVSVDANARASTTYAFHDPGRYEFACHLPGHYAYGMRGVVRVANARTARAQMPTRSSSAKATAAPRNR